MFHTNGIPAARRERIEAAVVAGGKRVPAPHEAWIALDPFHNGVRVRITGPYGFQRAVSFALDQVPAGRSTQSHTVSVTSGASSGPGPGFPPFPRIEISIGNF